MTSVCIAANCLYGPRLGGHAWVYLNWALGARANADEVIWLEGVSPRTEADEVARLLAELKTNLRPFGLADAVILCPWSETPLDAAVARLTPAVERAFECDAFVDLVYDLPHQIVGRFAKSALVNIDPGLLEGWMTAGDINVAPHDAYFTIGGRSFDEGRRWLHTKPCVALDEWDATEAAENAAFSTVTAWYANEWVDADGEPTRNDKRTGLLPLVDLPRRTSQPLVLALDLETNPEDDRSMLVSNGWQVVDTAEVASTPARYRRFVSSSLGEFGWSKPSHVRRQTGWISDRTVCYLASGKPVVLQDTGPNPALEEGRGVFRFSTVEEAAACLEKCDADYDDLCRDARQIAEEVFDARKVVAEVLAELI